MNISETLEETLNGGYGGLYGEVVTCDSYHLKTIGFVPDVVFDIGANIGIFSRYARTLFPNALIVSVEPDPVNCAHFRKFTNDPNIILHERAIGNGPVFHGLSARNGSGETYLSASPGFPQEMLIEAARLHTILEDSQVKPITLASVIAAYWVPGMKAVVKIDCEGAENSIWVDQPSMDLLRKMDHIALEIHLYALTGQCHPEVVKLTEETLASFESTHHCEREHVHFWATKNEYPIPKRAVETVV